MTSRTVNLFDPLDCRVGDRMFADRAALPGPGICTLQMVSKANPKEKQTRQTEETGTQINCKVCTPCSTSQKPCWADPPTAPPP